jgi:hypothetical protein
LRWIAFEEFVVKKSVPSEQSVEKTGVLKFGTTYHVQQLHAHTQWIFVLNRRTFSYLEPAYSREGLARKDPSVQWVDHGGGHHHDTRYAIFPR